MEAWGINYYRVSKGCSVGDVARAQLGDSAVFDYALPQSWVDDCFERGLDPRGNMVWVYDENDFRFGGPWPITRRGIEILALLAR